MRITLLGTGTSQGVPILTCQCPVCISPNSKDKRLRCSALIEEGNTHVLIDAGPDLRQQLLGRNVPDIDAVCITHEHSDHVGGLDDLRPYIFQKGQLMPLYALARVLDDVQRRYAYAFTDNPYPGVPRYDLIPLQAGQTFTIGECRILPLLVHHGRLDILGFRIGKFAYFTDVKSIPEETLELLHGVEYLVINALRREEHPSHCHLDAALDYIERIGARQNWLTHMSHEIGLHDEVNALLPPHVQCAWDGLTIDL